MQYFKVGSARSSIYGYTIITSSLLGKENQDFGSELDIDVNCNGSKIIVEL